MKDESFGNNETFGEEIGNTITHGVMAVMVLIMLPYSVVRAFTGGGEQAILDTVGISVFCICLFIMFATSAMYHSTMKRTTHKVVFNKLDHIAIFLAIAGSYTPISLSVIGGTKGIILLSIQWSMVLAGILIKTLMWTRSRLLSVPVYLIMGWSVVAFFPAFKGAASPELFWLILGGGAAYSMGCIFYATKFKFSHMVFHFFVNAGATMHFIGVVFFMRG
ncbi:MAG: hemolysin III family protein [Eubacteriales bacterium]|nr:hemolysin III family protein [Eubacteriales bacterium]MDD4717145.1 hemolysin III family protein [Eubacteriales bacterium]NCU26588.1 hemolysin III family protein [Candidatus Nomurabacteria bacterium]